MANRNGSRTLFRQRGLKSWIFERRWCKSRATRVYVGIIGPCTIPFCDQNKNIFQFLLEKEHSWDQWHNWTKGPKFGGGRGYFKKKKQVWVPGHAMEISFSEHSCAWKCRNIWTSMWIFFWNFLKFFQKLPSAYIFRNCTNSLKFVKFVKIVFDSYLNFIKFSNISKIF